MKSGHEEWACRVGMQSGHAEWACRVDSRYIKMDTKVHPQCAGYTHRVLNWRIYLEHKNGKSAKTNTILLRLKIEFLICCGQMCIPLIVNGHSG